MLLKLYLIVAAVLATKIFDTNVISYELYFSCLSASFGRLKGTTAFNGDIKFLMT